MSTPEPEPTFEMPAHFVNIANEAITAQTPIIVVTEPAPPDDQLTYEEATKAERDAIMATEAVDNLGDVIKDLQAQIDTLTTTTQAQTNQISRLTAAFGTLPCPKESGISDLMVDGSVSVETVSACVQAGICSCEMGYILISETWTPPA